MLLVIKEDVWAQHLKDKSLVHADQEMRLIDGDVPGAKRVDDSPMRGEASGGDDGRLEKTAIVSVLFLALVLVQLQKTPHKRKRDACFQDIRLMFVLIGALGTHAFFPKHRIRLAQLKQRR